MGINTSALNQTTHYAEKLPSHHDVILDMTHPVSGFPEVTLPASIHNSSKKVDIFYHLI
jgi:hypothetical protein